MVCESLERCVRARVRVRVGPVGAGDRAQCVAPGPPGRRGAQLRAELVCGARSDPQPQVLEAPDVGVERRGAYPESSRQPRQRERLESVCVSQLGAGADDRLGVETGPRRHLMPRAIARSIAGPGAGTDGPCPTTSSDGSRARSSRAEASAFGLSQVGQ